MEIRKAQLNFNADLFNELYWELKNCNHTYICNYGSGGSGKSHATAQNELIKCLESKEKILVIRKEASTLNRSVVSLFRDELIEEFGLSHFFTYNATERTLTNTVNGSQILFSGLDDPEKIKSIAGITRVWVEEANALSEEDFNKLSDRIRGNPQITLTYNPISVKHWLKARFHDTPNERVKVFHTTYLDNMQHVGPKFIADMEWYKENDPEHYRVYGLGKWGRLQVDKEFAYAFNQDKHVTEGLALDPTDIVYLSFDFNVDPITCIAAQHDDLTYIRILKEFRLANSDIYKLCDRIKAVLGDRLFLVTGDSTGKSRNAMTRGNVNYYSIIQEQLGLNGNQINLRSVNPSINNSRMLCNAIFERHENFNIDSSMEYLIDDLLYVEVDDSGAIDKSKDKHRSHLLDCLRYYLFTYHSAFIYPPK